MLNTHTHKKGPRHNLFFVRLDQQIVSISFFLSLSLSLFSIRKENMISIFMGWEKAESETSTNKKRHVSTGTKFLLRTWFCPYKHMYIFLFTHIYTYIYINYLLLNGIIWKMSCIRLKNRTMKRTELLLFLICLYCSIRLENRRKKPCLSPLIRFGYYASSLLFV